MRTRANCHPLKVVQGNGLCSSCYQREWKKKNLDRCKEHADKTLIKIKQSPERQLRRYGQSIKRTYGLTMEQYQSMLKKQGGVCFLCLSPPKIRRLHIDHDHRTGKIRALLCYQCNWYMALIDKDLALLERLFDYTKNK